ncbi:DUF4259 domain-containing protein [Dactylosporangium aurantiacum]|uniref:DUF4259 domain-containing protein n=1 Tax=Dactylosporangium aurantiacum TaxID=35754 RepID=A0A9Q9MGD5_9ACTN|nr:DUF4259 domain-containing protein [Dactylosporangium aurantiacum]MDG6106330.1 DUF4259 domain-containing protein [Dactylosporangium aurantiacum]UWZ58178.1 DUF4259 domain-containing protein [Dactylosporangium aurantiacum]
MAAYSTGPFDSDTAQDLLERFAELTVAQRLEHLRLVFLGGPRDPGGPFEPVDPTEVIAGAALVALALPGGGRVRDTPQMEFDEEVAAAAVAGPDAGLVRLALDATRAVAADDAWFAGWLGAEDRAASRHTVAVIVDVLAGHVAAMSGRPGGAPGRAC